MYGKDDGDMKKENWSVIWSECVGCSSQQEEVFSLQEYAKTLYKAELMSNSNPHTHHLLSLSARI
jgi:hypothetical protein